MSIASFLSAFNPFASSSTSAPAQWMIDWISGGTSSDSGVSVNGKKALSFSSFWQGVNVIAGDVGQLPLAPYRRTGDGNRDKELYREQQAFRLVRRRAHDLLAATTLKEVLTFHALVWGNGVAEIQRNPLGVPLGIIPLTPGSATQMRIVDNETWYVTIIEGNEYKLRPRNVLHIMGLSHDGLWGIPLWEEAKNSLGLGLAQEKAQNMAYKRGGRPSGVLESANPMKKEAGEEMLRRWNEKHEGLDNKARTALLHSGVQYKPIAFNAEQMQMIEGRKFQRTEAASWLNLPPHKVNDLERATFSNIEEQNADYLNRTLMRWLVKWQDEADEKLRTSDEIKSDDVFFEFNTAALLRGTLKSRYEAYRVGLAGIPFLKLNEVRRKENLNGVEGGDEVIIPDNIGAGGIDNDTTETPTDDTTARAAIRSVLAHQVKVERNLLVRAAEHSPNFCDWIDNFYPSKWSDTMARVVQEIGGTAQNGTDWAAINYGQVSSLVDSVTADELPDALREMFAGWEERIDELTDEIVKGLA